MLDYKIREENSACIHELKFETCKIGVTRNSTHISILSGGSVVGVINIDFLRMLEPLNTYFKSDLMEYRVVYLFSYLNHLIMRQMGADTYPIECYTFKYEEWLYSYISELTGYDEDDVADVIQQFYDEMEEILSDDGIDLPKSEIISEENYATTDLELNFRMYENEFVLSDDDGHYSFSRFYIGIGVFKRVMNGVISIYDAHIDLETCHRMTFLFKACMRNLLPLIYFRTKPRL